MAEVAATELQADVDVVAVDVVRCPRCLRYLHRIFLVQRVGVGTSYIAAARAVELLAVAGDIAAVRPTCALGN